MSINKNHGSRIGLDPGIIEQFQGELRQSIIGLFWSIIHQGLINTLRVGSTT